MKVNYRLSKIAIAAAAALFAILSAHAQYSPTLARAINEIKWDLYREETPVSLMGGGSVPQRVSVEPAVGRLSVWVGQSEMNPITSLERIGLVSSDPLRVVVANPPKGYFHVLWLAGEFFADGKNALPLSIESSCDLVLYLNGEFTCTYEATAEKHCVRKILPIEGRNFIMVRLAVESQLASFKLNCESSFAVALHGVLKSKTSIFRNPVVSSASQLELNLDYDFSDLSLPVQIFSDSGDIIFNGLMKNNLRGGIDDDVLSMGVYMARFTIAGSQYEELFTIGPILRLSDTYIRRFEGTADPVVAVNVSRLKILTEPKNVREENRNWQLKFITSIGYINSLRTRYSGAQLPNISQRLRIDGLRSARDDELLAYRIYVPTQADWRNERLPCVVILPPMIQRPVPFIVSPLIADHFQALEIARAAESLGVIVVWPGYRSMPQGRPIEAAHIYEILDCVESREPIDIERISLIGRCEAGTSIGLLLSDAPKKFLSAVFIKSYYSVSGDPNQSKIYSKFSDFRKWRDALDYPRGFPASPGRRAKIYVVHDGREDIGHGEVSVSRKFIDEARKNGVALREFMDGKLLNEGDSWLSIIKLTLDRTGDAGYADDRGVFYSSLSEIGPIEKVWGKKFSIILGTNCAIERKSNIAEAGANIVREWRSSGFGECNIINDVDVDKSNTDKNYLIIGGLGSNSAWDWLSSTPQVAVSDFGVKIGDKDYTGSDLLVLAVSRSEGGRRVLFIGSNALEKIQHFNMRFLRDGWCDYSIWRWRSYGWTPIAAGYYK